MSGMKRARARLSRENQVWLENELRESRRVSDAIAEVANVAYQARAVVRELGSDARKYMGAELVGLEALLSTFDGQRRELEGELAEIAALSNRTPSGALAAEASARRAQVEKRLATLTERAKEIRLAADQIASDLDSKQNEDLRERVRRPQRTRRASRGARTTASPDVRRRPGAGRFRGEAGVEGSRRAPRRPP